jgi:hypothetical protein
MPILWILLTVIVALVNQPQHSAQMCPVIYTYSTEHIFQIPSGAITSPPFLAREQRDTYSPISRDAIAHDRRQQVYVEHDGSPFEEWAVLPLKLTVNYEATAYSPWQIERLFWYPYTPHIEISWSPNDQWIAYRYQTHDNKQFIGIADATGRKLKEIPVPLADGWISFDSWAADSQYVAIAQQDSDKETHRRGRKVTFLSVPDLIDVTPDEIALVDRQMCVYNNSNYYSNCLSWSKTGHSVVFVNTHSKLIVTSLDGSDERRITLPYNLTDNGYEGGHVLWSSDNQHVAVSVFYENKNAFSLHIFGYKDQVDLGENRKSTLSDAHTREMQWAWPADGETLYFVRDNPLNAELFDIIAYENGQTRVIQSISNLQVIIEFYPAPDSNSLILISRGWFDATLYWLTPDGKIIQRYEYAEDNGYTLLFTPFAWSPDNLSRLVVFDGKTLELVVYESNGKEVLRSSVKSLDLMQVEWLGWIPCFEEF